MNIHVSFWFSFFDAFSVRKSFSKGHVGTTTLMIFLEQREDEISWEFNAGDKKIREFEACVPSNFSERARITRWRNRICVKF